MNPIKTSSELEHMHIFITIDYELHLSHNPGSVMSTLITPTKILSELLNEFGIKATFFVDMAYVMALEKLTEKYDTASMDMQLIRNQLSYLIEQGHSLQLHIHPQWFYSEFDGKNWQMDFNHCMLSDMDYDKAFNLFASAKLLLESISGQSPVAYRAGGYSLQTFSDHVKLLYSNGIKIDSSVLPGKKVTTRTNNYDYLNLPKRKYSFTNSVTEPSENGILFELPLSTVFYNPLIYIILKKSLQYKHHFRPYSNGFWQTGVNGPGMYRMLSQLFQLKVVCASIDGPMSGLLPQVYMKFKEISPGSDFVIIGHPKNFSPESIRLTRKFIANSLREGRYVTIPEKIEAASNF